MILTELPRCRPQLAINLFFAFCPALIFSILFTARNEPTSAYEHFERGLKYYSESKFTAALPEFNRAVQLIPDDATFLQSRGNAYFHLRKYDLALRDFDKSISINSCNVLALTYRSWTYERLGQNAKSSADLNRCKVILDKASKHI